MSNHTHGLGINLNLLRTFDVLMNHKNVTRAAESLFVSQSAMSYNLGLLRELLNDPLFERQGHTMIPTMKALELGPKVQQVLVSIHEDIFFAPSFDAASSEDTLVVGLTDYAEWVFGPLIYDAIHETAPRCSLVFQAVDALDSVRKINDGEVDLIIGVYDDVPAVSYTHLTLPTICSV